MIFVKVGSFGKLPTMVYVDLGFDFAGLEMVGSPPEPGDAVAGFELPVASGVSGLGSA